MELSEYDYADAARGLNKKYRRYHFTPEEVKESFWVIRNRKGTTFFRMNH